MVFVWWRWCCWWSWASTRTWWRLSSICRGCTGYICCTICWYLRWLPTWWRRWCSCSFSAGVGTLLIRKICTIRRILSIRAGLDMINFSLRWLPTWRRWCSCPTSAGLGTLLISKSCTIKRIHLACGNSSFYFIATGSLTSLMARFFTPDYPFLFFKGFGPFVEVRGGGRARTHPDGPPFLPYWWVPFLFWVRRGIYLW